MFQIKAKILYNKRVTGNYFHCKILAPKIAVNALPGQFVNIKVSDSIEPLLRRPFGIHRVDGAGVEILYEVLGEGTRILSQRKNAEFLDIIGPLGNGFDFRAQEHKCNTRPYRDGRCAPLRASAQVLVAGGMGVAPLLFLAERIVTSHKLQVTSPKPLVLIGAKTKKQLLCEKEFKKLGCEVKIATDDGSMGFNGKVTELLKKILHKNTRTQEHKSTIYACGPKPMLKEIALISKNRNIPAQVSLEEHMACGIGVCLGCTVDTKLGFRRVCKEGPVFNSEEIIW